MRAVAVAAIVASVLAGCGAEGVAAPRCEGGGQRLGLVAQSVPGAAYVPCVEDLPPGWSLEELDVDDAGTTLVLESDRADRTVAVRLRPSCEVGGATPVAPRDEGVRTYQRVDAIDPRYAGAFLDVFPGGCVSTEYDFERGPHVALVTELRAAVGLASRRQVRAELEAEVGVELDP